MSSPSITNNNLSASKLGVPIFHRRRRDWTDDQKLIEQINSIINDHPTLYDQNADTTINFLDYLQGIAESGYRNNADAMLLANWLRECMLALSRKYGNYDLRVHAIQLPASLQEILYQQENNLTRNGFSHMTPSLSTLFPDPKLRGFALERIQVLHRGDIVEYLSSLVSKEKESLMGYSATIMDLIHICEHKLKLRQVPTVCRFESNECDIWVPSLKLGIEVRNYWDDNTRESLISVLKTSNNILKADFLVVVCPDDLSDLAFHSLREIERNKSVDNLRVIRIGDFGKFLDKLIENKKAVPTLKG